MFDLLSFIYAKKNKNRFICNEFKVFTMRIIQRFSKFFLKFLLLFNQMSHYLKQVLIDKFREKFIFQFQQIIVNNDKFVTIKSLKKLIEKINQKLHNLKIIRFENFAFKDFFRIIFKIFIIKIVTQNNMFNVKKIMFVVDQIIMKTFYNKDEIDKNCCRCDYIKHIIRKCFLFKIFDI